MIFLSLILAASPKVAVLDVEAGEGVAASLASGLTEKLAVALSASKRFDHVLASSDLRAVLSVDQARQVYGCENQDCYASLGEVLDVDMVCIAKLWRTADRLAVDFKVINMKDGKALARLRREYLFESSLIADFGVSAETLAHAAFGEIRPLSDRLEADRLTVRKRRMRRWVGLGTTGLGLAAVGASNLFIGSAQADYDAEPSKQNYKGLAASAETSQLVYTAGLVSSIGGVALWWFNR
jgi:TolB-like protein